MCLHFYLSFMDLYKSAHGAHCMYRTERHYFLIDLFVVCWFLSISLPLSLSLCVSPFVLCVFCFYPAKSVVLCFSFRILFVYIYRLRRSRMTELLLGFHQSIDLLPHHLRIPIYWRILHIKAHNRVMLRPALESKLWSWFCPLEWKKILTPILLNIGCAQPWSS